MRRRFGCCALPQLRRKQHDEYGESDAEERVEHAERLVREVGRVGEVDRNQHGGGDRGGVEGVVHRVSRPEPRAWPVMIPGSAVRSLVLMAVLSFVGLGRGVTAPPGHLSQSDSRMIPASAGLHGAVTERRLQLPDLPEQHAHAANTIARHGRRGWRLDKPDGATSNDAIIALCMAVDAVEQRPEAARVLGFV